MNLYELLESRFQDLLDFGGIELFDRLFQLLAGAELDHGALGNADDVLRLVRVAALALLADLDLENAEVAQLDVAAGDQLFGDVVEGLLDDLGDVVLDQTGLTGDTDHQITLSHLNNLLCLMMLL